MKKPSCRVISYCEKRLCGRIGKPEAGHTHPETDSVYEAVSGSVRSDGEKQ